MSLTLSNVKTFDIIGVNLTNLFESYAAAKRRNFDDIIDTSDGKTSLLDSNATYNNLNADSINLALATAPLWVDYSEKANQEIDRAMEALNELDNLHAQRLKVTFGNESVDQQDAIDTLSDQIKAHFKRAENHIKQIGTVGLENETPVNPNESQLRLNAMRQLGAKLHEGMSQYRTKQRDFLDKLDKQKSGSILDKISEDKDAPLDLETLLMDGLTEEEALQLNELEDNADLREKEIIHLVQSINELASLFNELNTLVVEQGTILDRIDYNMESTLNYVVSGNEELRQADEHSKKTILLKLILFMILVNIVEIIILIWKHS